MKTTLVILLCAFGQWGFSQTIIKLISPQNEREEYQLVNITDTSFITIGHREDMGVWYGQYFELKKNIPDGKYEIYVDDTLNLRAYMRNQQKDSVWTYYHTNGKLQEVRPYKDGKLNGEVLRYYRNGALESKGTFINDRPQRIIKSYYESGEIKTKNYYDNGQYIKQEVFNKQGKIKHLYIPPEQRK